MQYPRMLRVQQKFDAPWIDDLPREVDRHLGALDLGQQITPGDTVAITAGSRGITHIAKIIKAAADHFKKLGAIPFVVPAMGSHGGGTAEGQRQIIESYGITEEFMEAEIRSSMETVFVQETPQGIPVHFDRNAFEADHVLVCGRVKPHTSFVGVIESGLCKMMLIGLGKHTGAKLYHQAIQDYSWPEIVTVLADTVLKECKIIAGLAIVESAYNKVGLIEAVRPNDFLEREKALLIISKKWMPRLPFQKVEILIVDELGKNISGTGMDTNVIGRKFNDHAATQHDDVSVKRIFVRGLTNETHGNACGLGMAEVTNLRTIDAVDRKTTAINALTGSHPSAASLPMAFQTDREAIDALFLTIGLIEPENSQVIHISNTLQIGEILVSEFYLPEIESRNDLEILEDPRDMNFDDDGNLIPVAGAALAKPDHAVL